VLIMARLVHTSPRSWEPSPSLNPLGSFEIGKSLA
jgi:hypothetical protein